MRTRPAITPLSFIGVREPNRSRWVEEVKISSHGVAVGLRSNQKGLLDRLKPSFPLGWELAPNALVKRKFSIEAGGGLNRTHYKLYANSKRRVHAEDERELAEELEGNLQLYVAEWSPRFVFVHAGVVAWKNKALIFPGRSFAGKSTLIAALLRAGAQYYSDEYALLDDAGRVYPYARRLALRQQGGLAPNIRVDPAVFGSLTGSESLPVGLVVFSQYREGQPTEFRPLSPGACSLGLLQNTVPVRRFPERSLAAVHAVACQARAIQGHRGEAADTVPFLLDLSNSI